MKTKIATALASLALLAVVGCNGGETIDPADSMESQLRAANVGTSKSQAANRSLAKADRGSQPR